MTPDAIAQAVLARHSLAGSLQQIGGLYTLDGKRNGKGCYVQFDGEPDEALLEEAADLIERRLSEDVVGR